MLDSALWAQGFLPLFPLGLEVVTMSQQPALSDPDIPGVLLHFAHLILVDSTSTKLLLNCANCVSHVLLVRTLGQRDPQDHVVRVRGTPRGCTERIRSGGECSSLALPGRGWPHSLPCLASSRLPEG